MNQKAQILLNIKEVEERISKSCHQHNRNPEEVTLMAVTKTKPLEYVNMALEAGLMHIGENRVQEAVSKRPEITLPCFLELIGPLQSNKVRQILACVDRIQTVDRLKLVQRLQRTCAELEKTDFPVLLQVNVGDDPSKHGCHADEAEGLIEAIQADDHLKLDGLMTIGEFSDDEKLVRGTFSQLRELRDRLAIQSGLPLEVLSMGMTGDLEWAIAEGSTLLRIGTALFGART